MTHYDFLPQVEARKILKPFSHDKYIKEPEPGVVYVNRRVSGSSSCRSRN